MRSVHFTLFALATAAQASFAAAEERSFDLSGFDAVQVSEGIHMIIDAGGEFSVTAESDEKVQLDRLELEVRRDTLRAHMDRRPFSLRRTKGWKVTVRVSMPRLLHSEASSGAELEADEMIGDDLDLEASNGASLSIGNIDGEAVRVNVSSGARARAEGGTCEDLIADASSGALIDMRDLSCETARADASSGARIDLTATDAIDASASSGAMITVYGKPEKIEQDASSSGAIRLR